MGPRVVENDGKVVVHCAPAEGDRDWEDEETYGSEEVYEDWLFDKLTETWCEDDDC